MGWSGRIRRWTRRLRGVTPSDLCFVFVSCQARRDGWPRIHAMMRKRGLPYRIVFAGPAPERPLREGEIHLERCRDSYEALPEKLVATCRYLQTLPFAMFAKLDDDMIVLPLKRPTPCGDYLGNVIDASDPDRRWHQGKCSPGSPWNDRAYEGDYVPWCSGGSGYVLSRRAVGIVAGLDTAVVADEEIYEDVMIAKALRNAGIAPRPLETPLFVGPHELGTA